MVDGLATGSWRSDGGIHETLRHRPTETEQRWGQRTIETITDNEALSNGINGKAKPDPKYCDIFDDIFGNIANLFLGSRRGPKDSIADPVIWKSREFNKEAAYLAVSS